MKYHIGISKEYEHRYTPRCQETGLVIEARRDIDYLSCETWLYYGERITTKKQLHARRLDILAAINKQHGTAYQRIKVA